MRRTLSLIRSLIGLAFFVLLLIPIIGPPLYVEVAGVGAPASITAKREEIGVVTGTWTRRMYVEARYRPAGADEAQTTSIAVDPATYDRLHAEEPTRLRYVTIPLPWGLPSLVTARLESQPPLGAFIAQIGSPLQEILLGLLVWLALLWLWSRWRRPWLAVLLGATMLGGILVLGSAWPGPEPAGARLPASATVRNTHEVTRIWESRRRRGQQAVQPYTIVELSFVPQGMTDPVIAVDQIDSGSAPGVEKGAVVPIRYSASDPRWAEIDGATRTYYWKNLTTFGLIALLVGALLLGGALFGRRRRRRPGRGGS